jgi:hypothetical protein
LESYDFDIEYATPTPKDPKAIKLPVAATVTVRLVPLRG